MANHGTDPTTRMRRLKESLEAMKAIWTEEQASYHGEFVNFDAIWAWPTPAQRPHPPILVGGHGPTVLDRVRDFGDAWFPNDSPELVDRAAELQAGADRRIEVQVIGVGPDPKRLEQLEAAGITRVLHWVPSAPRSVIEPHLERWERAIAELQGEA